MNVDNFKTMVAKTGLTDVLSSIYNDSKDTFDNATNVLNVLSSLYDNMLQGSMNQDEFNNLCLANMPIKVSVNIDDERTKIGYITWDGLTGSILLKSSATDNPTVFTICNYYSDTPEIGTVTFGNVIDFDKLVNGWSLKAIARGLNSSLNCSSLLMDAIDTLSTMQGNYLVSFKSKVDGYAGRLSGDSRMVYQKICDSFANSSISKVAAVSYIVSIYEGLTKATADDNDGSTGFASTDYYVEGFYGVYAVKSVLAIASQVVSTLVLAVSKAVGVVVSLFAGLANAVLNYSESETWASRNPNVINRNFSIPIMQVDIDRSTIERVVQTPEMVKWYDDLVSNGFMSYHFPGCFTVQWVDSTKVYSESYVSCDLAASYGANLNYNSIYNIETTGASAITSMWVDDNAITPSRSNWFSNMNHVSEQMAVNGRVEMDATINKFLIDTVAGGIFSIIVNALKAEQIRTIPFSITNTHTTPTDYTVEHATKIGDVLYFVNWMMVNDRDPSMTWEWLVNYLIPLTRDYLNETCTPMTIANIITEYDEALSSDITQESDAYYDFTNVSVSLGDYTGPFLTPPKKSSSSFMNTALVGIAAAAAAVGVGVAAFKVRRKIQLWAHRKQLDLEAKRYAYEDDPSDANWNAYVKSLRRYNLSTIFTGYSKLSYISGYEVDSSDTQITDIMSAEHFSTGNEFRSIIRPW